MKNFLYVISVFFILLSIIVLYAGAFGYYTSPGVRVSYEIAKAMGSSIAYMLVFYPIWKWVFAKLFAEPKKGSAFLCYCILIFLCSSYQSVNLYRKSNQLNKSAKIMEDMAKISLTGDVSILSQDKKYSMEEYGEMGPFLTLMRDALDFSSQEIQKLSSAADQADIDNILQLHRLCNFDRIREALPALQVLRSEIDASEVRRTQRMKEMDSEIELIVKQQREKESIIQSYHQGKYKNLIMMKEYYRIQRDFVSELQELIRFLLSVQGLYWEENETLVFVEDEHVECFNTHILRMVELAEEETRNFNEIFDQNQSLVNSLSTSDV